MARVEIDPGLNLSEAYPGMDQFMRELMSVVVFEKPSTCKDASLLQLGADALGVVGPRNRHPKKRDLFAFE